MLYDDDWSTVHIDLYVWIFLYSYIPVSVWLWWEGGINKKVLSHMALSSFSCELMVWSRDLVCCRKFSLCSLCCITKVSSIYLFHNAAGLAAGPMFSIQRHPLINWQLLFWLGTPWLPLYLSIDLFPGIRRKCCSGRTLVVVWCDVLTLLFFVEVLYPVIVCVCLSPWLGLLEQKGKWCDFLSDDAIPYLQSNVFEVFYQVLAIVDML